MTENSYLLKIPLEEEKWPENEMELIVRLQTLDRELEDAGYRHGIYNLKCYRERENNRAVCYVTTYGDLNWLPEMVKEIDDEIEVERARKVTEISDEHLEYLKKFRETEIREGI